MVVMPQYDSWHNFPGAENNFPHLPYLIYLLAFGNGRASEELLVCNCQINLLSTLLEALWTLQLSFYKHPGFQSILLL